MSTQDRKQELEDKILAKRQQIEFERTNLEEQIAFAPENRENPETMEETKNYDDPAQNVVDNADVNSLKSAEAELQALLKELDEL